MKKRRAPPVSGLAVPGSGASGAGMPGAGLRVAPPRDRVLQEAAPRDLASRALAPEEHALWHHVARQARPLPGKTLPKTFSAPPISTTAPPPSPTKALPKSFTQAEKATLAPLVGLERRHKQALAREKRALDARLDLHGLRENEAHAALFAFLARAHTRGARFVLVITGKGDEASALQKAYGKAAGHPPYRAPEAGPILHAHTRGRLKRLVPHWLADPLLRAIVLGYEPAAPHHGGAGALYVRLRA